MNYSKKLEIPNVNIALPRNAFQEKLYIFSIRCSVWAGLQKYDFDLLSWQLP